MGMGTVPMMLGIIIMFGGGLGVPLGMPPADEMPIMSNTAPEECVFYATWAGAKAIDPDANPTEKWMSQEELQIAWAKIKNAIKQQVEIEAADGADPAQKAGSEFIVDFAETLLTHAGMVFVSKLDVVGSGDFTVEGGMLIHLGDSADRIETKFRNLMKAAQDDAETEIGEVLVNGITFMAIDNEASKSKLLWAFRDGFFWAAIGEDAMRQMLENQKTGPPAWLRNVRERLPIERIATVSYLNARKLMPLLDLADEEEFHKVIEVAGIKDLKSVAWVGGLSDQGCVTRSFIDFDAKEPKGIFGLIHGEPIEPAELGRVDKDATIIMSQRLSPKRIYDFILRTADEMDSREELEQQIAQFEQMTGVDLEDELLDSLDDLVTVYGSFNMLNPTSGWVLSVKIKNEMVFQGAYRKFNEFVKGMSENGAFEVKQQTRNGKIIYSASGLGNGMMPMEPSWCEDGGELVFSLNRGAVSKHVRRDGVDEKNNIAFTEPMNQVFKHASSKRRGPVALLQFDFAEVLNLAVSTMRGLVPEDEELIPGSNLTVKDLPPADVIVNGVKPNVYGLYRTESGFELYQQQTFPGGSPGVTMGIGAILVLPAIETTRIAARRTNAANNMRQLAIAMHNYHASTRALPPAYSTDKDGNPLLSWRVHLLPYMEERALYDEFHLDEPWDSEHNRTLIEKMPDVFKSANLKLEPGMTTRLAVTGEGAMFGAPAENENRATFPRGIRFEDIPDGTSNSAMLVEVNDSAAVNWTAPKDFVVGEREFLGKLEGVFPSGTNIAFGDGSVQLIRPDGNHDILKALFTIDGGEVIDWARIRD